MRRTIRFCQDHQPWTVPYSHGVKTAQLAGVPHILGSHAVIHAAKSVGKLAAVFESMDHGTPLKPGGERDIRAMAADLMTVALRFANLYGFDLEEALVERAAEKNGEGYPQQAGGNPELTPESLKQAMFLAFAELRVWRISKMNDGVIDQSRWNAIDLVDESVPIVLEKLKGVA